MTTAPRPESVPESESNSQITAPAEEPAGAMTFFEHLSELRKRIIYSLYAIGIGAFIGVYVSKKIINWFLSRLFKALTKENFIPTLANSIQVANLTTNFTWAGISELVLAHPA